MEACDDEKQDNNHVADNGKVDYDEHCFTEWEIRMIDEALERNNTPK